MLPTSLTLQERVRRFNLGTPTPMHVGTHELVNDLWRELEKRLAVLEQIATVCADNAPASCNHQLALDFVRQVAGAAITKATGAA